MRKDLRSYILDEDTLALLLRMKLYTDAPLSRIVRWAIRYYALHGPWHVGPDQDRDADLGMPPPLEVGPTYTRRTQS
jgi:hypothetical protein